MPACVIALRSSQREERRMHPRMKLRDLACRMSGCAARLFLYLVGRSNDRVSLWPGATLPPLSSTGRERGWVSVAPEQVLGLARVSRVLSILARLENGDVVLWDLDQFGEPSDRGIYLAEWSRSTPHIERAVRFGSLADPATILARAATDPALLRRWDEMVREATVYPWRTPRGWCGDAYVPGSAEAPAPTSYIVEQQPVSGESLGIW